MNHFFSGEFLNAQSKTITVSAIILVLSSVASRLLGVWRDWLLTSRFGASSDLDVYFAAFRIPDLIYNILVFGGIIVAFLPLFSDYYAKNKNEAWRFANNTLNIFFAFLVLLSAVLFIFTPQLVSLIAPGFLPEQLAKTAFLSRLMFLSPIIFGIASIFSGILQYFGRFLAYSLAALLYNLGIIAGILFLAPSMGITGVAVGVVIGALLYLFIQIIPAIKCGFCYQPVFNLNEPSLRQALKLILPRTAGVAANQINLIAPTIIGSTLAIGSITIFNLANNIYSLPVGIIGVSWATAAFSPFSKYFAQNEIEKLAQKFSQICGQVAYFVIPASFLMFVLRRQIVDLLYYHGQFDAIAAALTAGSLGIFCLGIYFSAIMPVFFRLFFAIRNTFLPTLTTVIAVALNIFLNYYFVVSLSGGNLADFIKNILGLVNINDISVLGLALAYTAANAAQFLLLVVFLWQKNKTLLRAKEIGASFLKVFIAGIFSAFAVYLVIGNLAASTTIGLFFNVSISLIAGRLMYLLATILFKSPEILWIRKLTIKRKK